MGRGGGYRNCSMGRERCAEEREEIERCDV